ncbi:LPS export ABC transporter ATP-binding protein [Desulfothermus naphthae]
MDSHLQGKKLSKSYGKKTVVRDISISVSSGQVVGLLGPNGAGKTTTFYMLVGIISPTKGEVFLDNEDITTWPLYKRARKGISYLPQESSVFKKLTVEQNLKIILEFTGLSSKEQEERKDFLLKELGIHHLKKQKACYLSGGERRRLEIARSLIRQPKFILLDEPFAGIDPLAILDIQNIIAKLKQKGIGILISDHNVRDTMKICDLVYLVYEGKIILKGTPEDIANNEIAKRIYLGDQFEL